MVLLAHTQTLVLELLHHAVEYVYNTIGLILPHLTKPAAEVLFAQQFHTASYRTHRLDNLAIKHHQINKYKCDDALHYIQVDGLHFICQAYQCPAKSEQKQHEDEKIEFDAHDK